MLSITDGNPIGKIVDSKQFPKIGGKSVYLGLVDLEFDDDGMTDDYKCYGTLPEIKEPSLIAPKSSAKQIIKGIKKGKRLNQDLFKCFELRKTTADRIEPVPMIVPNQRDALYITGPSGSGKSHFVKLYLDNYIQYLPDNPIYLFSWKGEDELFTPYENKGKITRVPIKSEDYLDMVKSEQGLSVDDFENCLVIFDDIGKIDPIILKKHVDLLRDQILELGRSRDIFILTTTHVPCNGKNTQLSLIESNKIVFFPSKMNQRNCKYLLGDVFGLTNDELKRIKALRTKYWVLFSKETPRYVMYEKGCYMLD